MPQYPIVPKRSLGIFAGLQQKFARDDAATAQAEDRQQKLEDRVFGSLRQAKLDTEAEHSRSLEDALKEAQTRNLRYKEVDPTKSVYDFADPANPRPIVRGAPKMTTVNWDKVEGADGFYHQINPQTGEDRKTAVRIPVKPVEPKEPKGNTEAENKGAAFQHRVIPAGQRLNTFDSRGVLDAIATKGGQNWAVSSEGQRLTQAARTWIFAVLRPESGATITPDEEKTYAQTYIPQPFDSDEVLAQKRQSRREAEEGVAMIAGRALPKGAFTSAFQADSAGAANKPKGKVPTFEEWQAAQRAKKTP